MPSTTPVDIASIAQAIVWKHEGDAGEPKVITLPGSGVLTINGNGSIFRLANGSTLKGIEYLDESNGAIEANFDAEHVIQCLIEVEPGGTATVVHEDAGVTSGNRLYIPGGANATLSGLTIQVLRFRVDLGSGYVWRNKINLRPILASAVGYTPGNAGHWSGSPTTVQAAIDRLAAAVYAATSNTPIP